MTAVLREPITPALIAATALHALILLLVGFGFELPRPPALNTLAVTVTLNSTPIPPDTAHHVATQDQRGDVEPAVATAQMRLQTTMTISRELDLGGEGGDPSPAAAIEKQLADLEQALASLSDSPAPSNPRVGAVAARRSLDAEYLARWRARVEQVGNALYRGEPPAGNGDVRLLVSVRADGTLERIRVLQSSGNTVLDRAAQDTVVLAAPYPAFSDELARFTQRLDIVRTWQFRSQPVSSAP